MRNERTAIVAIAIFLLAALARFSSPAFSQEGESRVWTDKSGKHKVTAVLVAQEGSKVKLLREDGKTTVLTIDKLSEEDQAYLKSLKEDNPFDEGVVDDDQAAPSASSASSGGAKGNGRKERFPGWDDEINVVSFQNVQVVSASGVSSDWKVVPKPIESKKLDSSRSVPILNIPNLPRFSHPQNQSLAPLGDGKFLLSYTIGILDAEKAYFELCDVKKGTAAAVETNLGTSVFCGVSPDGKRALSINGIKLDGGFAKKSFVSITPIDPFPKGVVKAEATYLPINRANERTPRIGSRVSYSLLEELVSARWLGNDRIMTSIRNELTVWDVASCSAIYSMKLNGESVVVAPTRDYFAVASAKEVNFFDAESADPLGSVELTVPEGVSEPSAYQSVSASFSPDGTKLAVSIPSTTWIVDLKSGQIANVLKKGCIGAVIWTSNDYVLLGGLGGVCCDIEKGIPICSYLGLSAGAVYAYGKLWSANNEQLFGVEIPHAKAIEAYKNLNLDEAFDVHPGTAVSIKTDLNGLVDQKEVEGYLQESIKKAGLNYDPKSDIVVVAKCVDTGQTEEITGAEFEGRGPLGLLPPIGIPGRGRVKNAATIDLKIFAETISIEKKGKEIYRHTRQTTGPNTIEIDPDKTVEQQMREENKPEPDFYRFPLPKYVRKDGGGDALMSAMVGPDGIR